MPTYIDKETYQQAVQNLPNINELATKIRYLSSDLISTKFKSDSNFSIAAVCFQDVSRTLLESRYALLESFAHKIWYLEKTSPPDEINAVFFSRFYVDDAVLRLYSAAEHLAKAVVFIFDIGDENIKNNRAGSRFKTVRKILLQTESTHVITKTIDELYSSEIWKTMISYRDDWVHNQPPIISGIGMAFERKRRWKVSNNIGKLGISNGDAPKYSIDDLLGFAAPALIDFSTKLNIIVEFYVKELEKKGITFGKQGLQVSLIKSKAR